MKNKSVSGPSKTVYHTHAFAYNLNAQTYCLHDLPHTSNNVMQMFVGWSMTSSPVTVEPCTVPCGPMIQVSRDPLEMFSHFFTNDLLSHIVRETNRYTAQYLAAKNSTTSWETTIDELKAYLGFMVVTTCRKSGITGPPTVS